MKNKWWILAVTTSGTSLVFLDNTVMPVALPTIQERFHYTDVGLVWVVNAYLLALTTLLLIGGRLVDLFGKRAVFNSGMAIFCIGSVLGGLSFSRGSLILSRLIQGVGGALIIPATSTLLIATFPKGQRAQAIGINVSISSLFLTLGPIVGGFLTQYVSWRYIFFINIPLVIFGLAMSVWMIPRSKKNEESFHFLGAIPLSGSIIALVIALMEGERLGWASWPILTLFILAPALFCLFLWVSQHTPYPILDLSVFRKPLYAGAAISIFSAATIITITVIWSIYFQKQLHYTPSQTGLIILTATILVFLMAPLGGYLADRFTPKIPIYTGFATLLLSLVWIAWKGLNAATIDPLLPGIALFGFSIPLIFSPSVALGLSHALPGKLGAASGMMTSIRQIATTIGIALFTAVYQIVEHRTNSYALAFSTISFVSAVICLIGLSSVICILNFKNANC